MTVEFLQILLYSTCVCANLAQIRIKKDTITVDDIDALTGATITSKAVADAVANAINVVESLG